MDNRAAFLLVLGLVVGVVLGVEAYRFSLGYSCPQPACVDKASVNVVTDREYYVEAHKILANAKDSIHLVCFELKYYPTFKASLENQIIEDLVEAKQRGVEVKIIVDEFSEDNNAFDYLKENGIDIKHDSENVTTHAKLLIVDGRIVLVGSTNLSYYALEKNNEANVVIEDEEVAQDFEGYFDGLWQELVSPAS